MSQLHQASVWWSGASGQVAAWEQAGGNVSGRLVTAQFSLRTIQESASAGSGVTLSARTYACVALPAPSSGPSTPNYPKLSLRV
jgi:hypothetical protein